MIDIADYNYWVAFGTLGLQLAGCYLLVEYFFLKKTYILSYVARYGLWIVVVVSGLATVFSFAYSEVYGFLPCGFCWLQRGFLYAVLVACVVALWRTRHGERDTAISAYGITFSLIGAFIGLYQHYMQMGGSEFVTCPTAGAGIDCAQRLVFEFGYLTIPLMSASIFAFLIVVFFIYGDADEKKNKPI